MSGKIFCSSIFASWGFWYSGVVPQEVTPFFQLTQNIVHYRTNPISAEYTKKITVRLLRIFQQKEVEGEKKKKA
jgi:hypothetical protein